MSTRAFFETHSKLRMRSNFLCYFSLRNFVWLCRPLRFGVRVFDAIPFEFGVYQVVIGNRTIGLSYWRYTAKDRKRLEAHYKTKIKPLELFCRTFTWHPEP